MAEEAQESLHLNNGAETEAAAAASEGGEEAAQEGQEQPSGKGRAEPGSAFLGSYGNSVGDKVQAGLAPVGKPLGKGLGAIGSPIGGLVEPLVGGVMKSGKGFGDTVGVGAGNQDQKKREEMEAERKPVGGQEQTGGNPLGLSDP